MYGAVAEFEWEVPSFPLSMLLLTICAAFAAAIGTLVQAPTRNHGILLFSVFLVTGLIQYITNSRFGGEIFTDEGFGHDDAAN